VNRRSLNPDKSLYSQTKGLNMNTKTCIYCNQTKKDGEFSLEHIFPDALGGSIFPDETFKAKNVCKGCNSLSGLFIDGPFIKNFFLQNDLADAYLCYTDLEKPSALPLRYMGTLRNTPIPEDEICDIWFGPHGGLIYHVRQRSDPKYDVMIGGNPIDSKKNKGTIFIFANHRDTYWNTVLLLSSKKSFKKARKISGNINLAQEIHEKYFNEPEDDELTLLEFFKSIQNQEHDVHFTQLIGFEQRFMAKFALGLGHNLFGESFLETTHAKTLRNAMWEKELENRESLLNFSNCFMSSAFQDSVYSWEGVHTLFLLPSSEESNIIYLIFCCFGRGVFGIPLCDSRTIWGKVIPSDGIVYTAVPQVKFFAGPFTFPEYAQHRKGVSYIQELQSIESFRVDVSQLPSIADLQ
jgi:hypothetical protein